MCLTMHLDFPANIFKISGDSAFVVVFEHDASQLLLDGFDLLTEDAAISAVYTQPGGDNQKDGLKKKKDTRWGLAMAACTLVSVTTLVGVVFFALNLMPWLKKHDGFVQVSSTIRSIP